MQDLHAFRYDYNYSIFGRIGCRDAINSASNVAALLESALSTLKDAIGLKTNSLLMLLAANPGFPKFISSFVCLVFPPYSPLVINNDRHESSVLLDLVHDFTRNLLHFLSKTSDPEVASAFGLCDPRFMLNLLNLYWRNNEETVAGIVTSCQKLNRCFVPNLVGIAKPLLENIQKEVDHFQFILSGIQQGRSFETARTFTRSSVFAARSDTSSTFDRSMLFVDKDTVLLDFLAFLETVLHCASEEHYADLLSTDVSTSEGTVQLPTVLTNTYYLMTYLHSYMLRQNAPVYKIENLQARYTLMFQRCFFYRCKIVALSALMSTIKYNVFLDPGISADYCYNWLVVFTQMDGEEYVSTRDVIIDDLREINFHDHVDKWCSISNTWLPAELEQLKAMVPSTCHFKPVEPRDDLKKIREITGVDDDELILECLEKHNFDVSNAIIELVNRPSDNTAPISVPAPAPQPRRHTDADYNFSLPFLPKESRQAVLNYWDYVNRPGVYDDDYDDGDELEGDFMPLNAKLLYHEMMDSSDGSENGASDRDATATGPPGAKPRDTGDRKYSGQRDSGVECNGSRGSRGNLHPRGFRGDRGRRPFNRKRNTISMDAFE